MSDGTVPRSYSLEKSNLHEGFMEYLPMINFGLLVFMVILIIVVLYKVWGSSTETYVQNTGRRF